MILALLWKLKLLTKKKETDNRNFLLMVYRGIKPNYWQIVFLIIGRLPAHTLMLLNIITKQRNNYEVNWTSTFNLENTGRIHTYIEFYHRFKIVKNTLSTEIKYQEQKISQFSLNIYNTQQELQAVKLSSMPMLLSQCKRCDWVVNYHCFGKKNT